MRTPQEIRDTEFQKSVSGYKTTDVEMFLEEIAEQIEILLQKKAEIDRRLAEILNENRELKESQGSINNVLISAQKLADQIIGDANQKASDILAEASQKADQMIQTAQKQVEIEQQRAQQVRSNSDAEMEHILHTAVVKSESMIAAAHDSVARQQLLFDKLKIEIVNFKKEIISRYKEQLESLSMLPDEVPFDSGRAAEAIAFSWDQEPDFGAIRAAVSEESKEIVQAEKPVEVEVIDEPIPSVFEQVPVEEETIEPVAEESTVPAEGIFTDDEQETPIQENEHQSTFSEEPFFQSGRLSFGEEDESDKKRSIFKKRK